MKSSFSVSHVHAARYMPARPGSPLSMCAFISAYDDTGIVLRTAGGGGGGGGGGSGGTDGTLATAVDKNEEIK